MLTLDLGAERPAEFQQCESAAHRTLGIVFGGLIGAESRKDVVAGVLQYAAPMGVDDDGTARQRVVHHRTGLLGVQPLAQRGGTDHVEEQDADLL